MTDGFFAGEVVLSTQEALDMAATLLEVADTLRRVEEPTKAFACEGMQALLLERLLGSGPGELS